MNVLGARSVRAAALFCPLVEEPEREAGPAAMGHPPKVNVKLELLGHRYTTGHK